MCQGFIGESKRMETAFTHPITYRLVTSRKDVMHFDNLGIGPKPLIGAPYVTLNENVTKREVAHVSLLGIAILLWCVGIVPVRYSTLHPTPSHLYWYCASHTTVIFHTLHFLPVLLPPPSLPPLTLSLSFLFPLSVWTPHSPLHFLFYFPPFLYSKPSLTVGAWWIVRSYFLCSATRPCPPPLNRGCWTVSDAIGQAPNNHNGGNVLSIPHKAPVHWPFC